MSIPPKLNIANFDFRSVPLDTRRQYINELEDALTQRDKIRTIKAIRQMTDMGLKESKDVVEAFTSERTGLNKFEIKNYLRPIYNDWGFDLWKDDEIGHQYAMNLDYQYNQSKPHPNNAAKPDDKPMTAEEGKKHSDPIMIGMQIAVDNWKAMGFKTPYDACFVVLANLEGKGRVKPAEARSEYLG